MDKNIWVNGMMGVIIGDALGMPVQFMSRKEVRKNPVTKMEGFGTYNMPKGTWSDDSSMALATLDSIRENQGINCDDIMKKFVKWTENGEYTPAGIPFDQGYTCMEAIEKYIISSDYSTCGRTGERANGNGALMRIMPVCLYVYIQHKNNNMTLNDAVEYVHKVSALTHNHLRSKMACGIYFFMVQAILDEEGSLMQKLQRGIKNAKAFYEKYCENDEVGLREWKYFKRMENMVEFAQTVDAEIKSSGYVVDTIEAAVWSVITTESFEDGLLKAVNLGEDTDTVGAVAGGLAGLYYGYGNMPLEWRDVIIKGDEIVKMCEVM